MDSELLSLSLIAFNLKLRLHWQTFGENISALILNGKTLMINMVIFSQDYLMPIHLTLEISMKKAILLTLGWENLNKTLVLNGKINYDTLQFIKNMTNIYWKTIIYLHSSPHSKLLKSGKIQFSSMISIWDNILKLKVK